MDEYPSPAWDARHPSERRFEAFEAVSSVLLWAALAIGASLAFGVGALPPSPDGTARIAPAGIVDPSGPDIGSVAKWTRVLPGGVVSPG
jgi:hypothetical protein